MRNVFFLLLFLTGIAYGQKTLLLHGDDNAIDSLPRFLFVDVIEANLGQYYEGYAIFLDVDSSFYVTAGADSFKIGILGTYDVGSVQASPGDTVYVPISASASCSTKIGTLVTVGYYSDTYSVTTITEGTPNQFTYTDITNAELSTVYQDSVIIAGIGICDAIANVFTVGAEAATFRVGVLGDWTQFGKTVSDGDTIWIRLTSSAFYSTNAFLAIDITGIIDSFSVMTKVDPGTSTYYIVDKVGNKAMLFKTGTYAIKLKD